MDFDPKCEAVKDYRLAFDQLYERIEGRLNGKQLAVEA